MNDTTNAPAFSGNNPIKRALHEHSGKPIPPCNDDSKRHVKPSQPNQRGTWLSNLSDKCHRPMYDLIVLTKTNDPFNVEMAGRKEEAEWFAEQYRQFGFGVGTHLRRVHYRLVSQAAPIVLPDGTQFENTQRCWKILCEASCDARYLDLVDIEDFVDRRNRESNINLVDWHGRQASLEIEGTDETISMPPPPELCFSPPKIPQRYHLEIVCEKSTVDDILLPLGEQYEINVTCCVGEISVTRCRDIVQRAKASGRPCRILYISDFDPAGQSMPVACARKIEFFVRKENLDLDIHLRPIVLTHEQCQEYELPRTPLKETENRSDKFEARYGEGATELDALEALHPGELRNILVQEIERYYDVDLDENVNNVASGLDGQIDDVNETVHDEFADEIGALNAAYTALEVMRKQLWEKIENRLNEEEPFIEDTEWPEPCDGDEHDDPLFNSTRSYVDQVDRFKEYQGKEVKGSFENKIHPDTIALAWQLRAEGLSYKKIGLAMAEQGHVTSNGKPHVPGTIFRWLRDRPLAGEAA